MRTIVRSGTLALALIATGAFAAAAQQTPRGLVEVGNGERAGLWLGLGVGFGGEAYDLRDGLGYADRLYRPTVSFRLGGTVNPSLRLGGEALVWINERGNTTQSLTSLLFVGQLYPAGEAGLYLKGGLGLGHFSEEVDGFNPDRHTGVAALAGVGYEVPIARQLFLVPSVDVVQHWYSERNDPGFRERLLNFGLGIVFQTGR